MNKFIPIAAIIALLTVSIVYYQKNNQIDAFSEWKKTFGTPFEASEQIYRRFIFEKNVLKVENHNADLTQTYKMAINQFSIYTDEEFKLRFLTEIIVPESAQPLAADEHYELPEAVDWVAQGKVSRVKNQGQCGSCWAFSATGVSESFALLNGKSVELSEQQLVDCSTSLGNHGCNGGWPSNALKYVQKSGLQTESQYPYVGRDQTCKHNGGDFKISNVITATGCSGLTNAITGRPLSVTVDASNWSHYSSGIFKSCGTSINHAVLLVGVDGSYNWKVKNSWGTSWGENGYIRLSSGNTCGICSNGGVYVQ